EELGAEHVQVDAAVAADVVEDFRRLRKVRASRQVESSDDMEDVFNQERMLNEDEGIELVKDVEIAESKGRQADKLAEIYNIDLDHSSKVLSSAASITIPVVSATIPAAALTIVAAYTRKKKGVIIRDPEEELPLKTPAKTPKVKDKGKGILVEAPKPMKKKDQIEMDAEYARKLQQEIDRDHDSFNKDIDWDAAMDHVNLLSREEMEAEDQEIIKSINETLVQKAAKRRKLTTPLAQKVPVVDYQILLIDNKPRYLLSRFTLEQLVNVTRLQVEEESEMSLKLLRIMTSKAQKIKLDNALVALENCISSEESPSKKKFAKAKKVFAAETKTTKKKAKCKADRGKSLNVLSELALSEADQLNEATKRSKKDFHILQASGAGDGTNFESGDSKSEKESYCDSGEENDDENDSEDENDDDGNGDDDVNDGDGDDDANDDDDTYDDDEQKTDRIKILILNQSSIVYYKEEEKIDDEGKMDEEEDDEVTKELYNDVNVNLGNRDADMTDADQGNADQQNVSQESRFEKVEEDAHVTRTPVLVMQNTNEPVQSSSVSSDFISMLLNHENPSLANNEIASLMDTTTHHEEPRSQTSSLYTVPVTKTPKVTSIFTTTIPPPPSFFNPLPQQATPTPTPTTYEATISFPLLLDLSYVFKSNDKVTNLEKDLLEIKHVDQYAQALSFIPAIVDHYINNKLREVI
nr:hypothetical protein [Tanacetum cinerariifolium]